MNNIVQSCILAQRKNGIIKQIGVSNSNLTLEVDDYCADSVIKKDVIGVCIFFTIEGMKPIFFPLDQSQSLIKAIDILKGLYAGIYIPDPLDPTSDRRAILKLYNVLNSVAGKLESLEKKVI